jgi:hypothetical protein
MHDARIAGRFPTRRPKERSATIPIEIKQKGHFNSVQLASSNALGMLVLPKLERAAFLAGKPAMLGVNVIGTQMIAFGKTPNEVAAALKAEALQSTANIDVTAFVRMLAKIGYSFAVANIGPYPLSEVPVLPLIHGKTDDGGTWVGSADFRLEGIEDKNPQHALGLVWVSGICGEVAEKVLVAQVKLFSNSGANGYEIIVRRTLA